MNTSGDAVPPKTSVSQLGAVPAEPYSVSSHDAAMNSNGSVNPTLPPAHAPIISASELAWDDNFHALCDAFPSVESGTSFPYELCPDDLVTMAGGTRAALHASPHPVTGPSFDDKLE
ncbi:hypothetical protein AURDEDRAFT_172078 [Auricularia subglabra TFB-10046 SS5]|nr:hypothetical protein AURDEDRAFT_172078 [Auricularia subglabra TFB-10046 SS5]